MARRLKCPECGSLAVIYTTINVVPMELVIRRARCSNTKCRALMKSIERTILSGSRSKQRVFAPPE